MTSGVLRALRVLPPSAAALAFACACSTTRPATAGRWVDLTHTFDAGTIYWPTDRQGFRLETLAGGDTPGGWFYAAKRFCAAEHGGTHVDAPYHFARRRSTIERIGLDRLIGPAVVLDVEDACARDRDHLVSVAEFEAFERRHGRIPQGAIVLIRTGFSRYWPDRERYLGTAELGPQAPAKLHFPGLAPRAALWLATRRRIAAVGIDTASIDRGQSRDYQAHRILFAKEVPAFENVANLHLLPPTGSFVVALPMKIGGGTGAPLRIVARVPAR